MAAANFSRPVFEMKRPSHTVASTLSNPLGVLAAIPFKPACVSAQTRPSWETRQALQLQMPY